MLFFIRLDILGKRLCMESISSGSLTKIRR